MKTTMVIPSYWAREAALGTKKTDAVYDHPTPLDEEGTLARALRSLDILEDKDFEPLKAFLKSKNVNFTVEHRWPKELVVKPEGCGVIYIADPDGIPIEIQEEFRAGEY